MQNTISHICKKNLKEEKSTDIRTLDSDPHQRLNDGPGLLPYKSSIHCAESNKTLKNK